MNTDNAHYGYFEINDIVDTDYAKKKRVIGQQPKILKDADYRYSGFKRSGNTYKQEYEKKNYSCLDNCRDIFRQIDVLKKDIDKYRSIGVEVYKDGNGVTREINWNKIAIRTEKELHELYNLL